MKKCICILMTMQACGGKNNKVVNAINDNEKETNYYGEVVENNIVVEGAKEEVAEEKKTVIGGLVDKGVNAYSWAVNKVSGYVPEQVQEVWNKMPSGVKIAVVLLLINFLKMGINKFRSWQAAPVTPTEEKKEYKSIITGTNDGNKDDFLEEQVIGFLDEIVEETEQEGRQVQRVIDTKAKDGLPTRAADHQFEQMTVFDMDDPKERVVAEQAAEWSDYTRSNREIRIRDDHATRDMRRVYIYRQLKQSSRGDLHMGIIPDGIYLNKDKAPDTLRNGIVKGHMFLHDDNPPGEEPDQTVSV